MVCLTSLCDWSKKNSRQYLHQSGAKLTPTSTWLPMFSRALGSLLDFTFDSYWLLQVFSILIGSYRCFLFLWLVAVITLFFFFLTVLNRKVLYLRRAPQHLRFKFSTLMLYSYLVVKNSFICLMKSTYLC